MKQIFVLGAYGQNNIGDDALLEVFKEQLKDYNLIFNSARPADTEKRFGVKAVPTYLSIPRFARPTAFARSQAIVFGGGSLLKEIEGSTPRKIAYLIRIILLLLAARIFGKKTFMLGVGMGPLHGKIYKKLSLFAANMTDLICVRDTASAKLLQELGVKSKVLVTADPVFLMQPGELKPENAFPFEDAKTPLVIAIPRYSLEKEEKRAFAEACDLMVERYSARILLIPFQVGFSKKFDDVTASEEIKNMMRYGQEARIWTVSEPRVALAAFARANLILSARLHGLIFGAIQNVPLVAINYEVKVGNFMSELGLSRLSLTSQELKEGKLKEVMETAWQMRQNISYQISNRVTKIKRIAASNFEAARKESKAAKSNNIIKSGSILLVSTTIVNAGNYISNLILGRWLGPAGFADFSLMVTLLLVVAFISSTLQMVSAKFTAMYAAEREPAKIFAVRALIGKWAWGLGILLGLILGLGAPLWSSFFSTASPLPFVLLSIGLPIYLGLGVDRGVLQGRIQFGILSLSYQSEMWTRLIGIIVLVALGFAVNGAVGAITLSLAVSWVVSRKARSGLAKGEKLTRKEKLQILSYSGPVCAALIGQVIINNSDILMVKHFFSSEEAGHYAAVALIGRIVFFATWSIVTILFPIVAQAHQKGQPHRHYLWIGLGIVGMISSIIVLATIVIPNQIILLLFGETYLHDAGLLWLYALLTAVYAMANVVINYRLSLGNGAGSFFAVLAGICQVSGIWLLHSNLTQIILVQLVVMSGLLLILLVWNFLVTRRSKSIVALG
ncbi:MAG: polysaccharide pyruvyl transferase family protein [Chloroflexi bacterium]|uniref:Polysaccharide pyruvyl transferase family protein n=1 Tax=Candidatus Chlorohelix allophototropha TaxID=3003348 RepID=A0A8T7M121_9CHLR|nr:polysaccharide pyruvyl transferase family protein [Chloroflexota bacterium]WJW66181.1 polysaccharide pyruvyl transferase family protein [Chloroflexota bacterium L227-S17]